MSNNKMFLSHENNGTKDHKNGLFKREKNKLSKAALDAQKERMRFEKEKRKLEELIEKKIEEADKKEAKQKSKILHERDVKDKSQKSSEGSLKIPTIDLETSLNADQKEKNSSKLFNKIKNIILEYKNKKSEHKKLLEEKKKYEQFNKEERLKLKNEEKARANELKLQKQREKEERKKQLEEERKTRQKQIKEEKYQEKLRKIQEKERKKQEQQLLNLKDSTLENESKIAKKTKLDEKKQQLIEKRKLEKEKKEQEKLKREEERKQKFKEEYEAKVRRKREKAEKEFILVNEKREKAKRIKKEKEQDRKERKEKALLIRKAREESKQKERLERKTFKEKVTNWYENLSFVKDRRNRREMQRQTLLIDFEGADAVRSDEKVMYKYVAKNGETGKVETGMFAAFSKLDVHSFLLAEGYEVYEITPQKNFSKPLTIFSPKFKASELDFFLTQLSTFLKSGITLVDSVKILSKQSKKMSHKNIYKSIIYELTMGENFSEALSKQGTIFPKLLINMIKTSELTGDLPETLDDMADYYRETEKTRKQMISALTYPIVVLTFAFVILIFIMIFVIPEFVSIYGEMEAGLPRITLIIISISNFLKLNWIYLLIGICVFILIFIILYKNIKVFKTVIQSLLMNVPIMGKIIIYNEVTMFTKTFASLLNHNVYITDCMEVLSKITNNEIYKMLIFDTITNLARGEAISNSFKNHWAFPSVAYEMILTGEKTGQLGNMMDKVADYYQEQHKNAVGQIKALIEPVMIVILAGIVGVILLSVVLPMFDMYQNIGV